MNVGQLQNLKTQVFVALEQAQYIAKIRDRISVGATWKVGWSEGSTPVEFDLTTDQKELLEKAMIKDMEDDLKISMDGIKKSLK